MSRDMGAVERVIDNRNRIDDELGMTRSQKLLRRASVLGATTVAALAVGTPFAVAGVERAARTATHHSVDYLNDCDMQGIVVDDPNATAWSLVDKVNPNAHGQKRLDAIAYVAQHGVELHNEAEVPELETC